MFPTIASAFATLCYCLSAFLIYKQLGTAQHQRWVALAPAVIGMLLQAAALNLLIIQPQGLNLGFFAAFSLIAWLISIQILLSSIYRRIESLGIIVFLISGLANIAASMHFSDHLISTGSNAIQGHIMVSIIAYSLITLGAFQAGLLAPPLGAPSGTYHVEMLSVIHRLSDDGSSPSSEVMSISGQDWTFRADGTGRSSVGSAVVSNCCFASSTLSV